MSNIIKKIQCLIEEHIFRKDYERTFIVYFSIINISTIIYTAIEFQRIISHWLLSVIFLGFPLIFILLLPKIIRQYKMKHLNSDKEKWKTGFKGKLIVIFRWII